MPPLTTYSSAGWPRHSMYTQPPNAAAEAEALSKAEQAAQAQRIQEEAVRSGIQDEINNLQHQKDFYVEQATGWGKLRPGSAEQQDAIQKADNIENMIRKKRGELVNPNPASATTPAQEPKASQMPSKIEQKGYPPKVMAEMQPTTKPAPSVPNNTAQMPSLEQLQQPSRPPLNWKFGGAEGEWNQFNPDTGQSTSASGGPIERPSTPDYLTPGIGGGAPSPTQTAPVMADVTRGGGGFYMPSENDVAYLPDSVIEEAKKREELAAIRNQQQALESIPSTVELPPEIAPPGTRVPLQDYMKVLPALLQLRLYGERYQSPQQKVQELVQAQGAFDAQIKALAEQAAQEASSIQDEAERARVAEKYQAEIERLKSQKAQVANILGVQKDLLGGF